MYSNVRNIVAKKPNPKPEAQKAKVALHKSSYSFYQASIKFRKQKIANRLYRSTWEILEQEI